VGSKNCRLELNARKTLIAFNSQNGGKNGFACMQSQCSNLSLPCGEAGMVVSDRKVVIFLFFAGARLSFSMSQNEVMRMSEEKAIL